MPSDLARLPWIGLSNEKVDHNHWCGRASYYLTTSSDRDQAVAQLKEEIRPVAPHSLHHLELERKSPVGIPVVLHPAVAVPAIAHIPFPPTTPPSST